MTFNEYIVMMITICFGIYIIIKAIITMFIDDWNAASKGLNAWSYKRFANFYDRTEFNDEEFDNKLKTIYNCIVHKGIEDIAEIRDQSGCETVDECVMKIMYLKNKRVIDNYYINLREKTVKRCTAEDEALINMYTPYLYGQPRQIENIIVSLPKVRNMRPREAFDTVEKDIKYLLNKKLINGIRYDEIDKKLIYYTIEKKLRDRNYVTKTCPNCGALVEVNIGLKTKCEYCDTIIESGNEDYSFLADKLNDLGYKEENKNSD